jgi:hypothetical protein
MKNEQSKPTSGMEKQTTPTSVKDGMLVALIKTLLNWNNLKSGIKKRFFGFRSKLFLCSFRQDRHGVILFLNKVLFLHVLHKATPNKPIKYIKNFYLLIV